MVCLLVERFFMWLQLVFFFLAEDGIRDGHVTGVQTCALPISTAAPNRPPAAAAASQRSSISIVVLSVGAHRWHDKESGLGWPDSIGIDKDTQVRLSRRVRRTSVSRYTGSSTRPPITTRA